MNKDIKCAVVGATGYSGVELLRLLSGHPHATVATVTSRAEAGRKVAELFPNLHAIDLEFESPEHADLNACDLVFFATPNGTAMHSAPALLDAGAKVIDLAADFRLTDVDVWQRWYGMEHACPDHIENAVYGLPEMNREQIKDASLVANPGCYVTAVTLGLLPLLRAGMIDETTIIADAKSGVSGAGRGANVGSLYSEVSENFKAYKVPGHRHLPEISQNLSQIAGHSVDLTFVPHLLPQIRGIHATLYAKISRPTELQTLFTECYEDEPFVQILPSGSHPETRATRGTNVCQIAPHQPQSGDTAVVLSVIDNLTKGAAGQAVQNMNLMFGLTEETGLQKIALMP